MDSQFDLNALNNLLSAGNIEDDSDFDVFEMIIPSNT
jgi:hypothetical protein